MSNKKTKISKEEADRRYEAMIGKFHKEFAKGGEKEKKDLEKAPKLYKPGEGIEELPLDQRERHLED